MMRLRNVGLDLILEIMSSVVSIWSLFYTNLMSFGIRFCNKALEANITNEDAFSGSISHIKSSVSSLVINLQFSANVFSFLSISISIVHLSFFWPKFTIQARWCAVQDILKSVQIWKHPQILIYSVQRNFCKCQTLTLKLGGKYQWHTYVVNLTKKQKLIPWLTAPHGGWSWNVSI